MEMEGNVGKGPQNPRRRKIAEVVGVNWFNFIAVHIKRYRTLSYQRRLRIATQKAKRGQNAALESHPSPMAMIGKVAKREQHTKRPRHDDRRQ